VPQKRAHGHRARSSAQLRVILCYAHRDEGLRNELEKHLSALKRSAVIRTWHDRKISPGTEFDVQIEQHLVIADLVLLLISPDFMTSDYCYTKEMAAALKRHHRGAARVIPIILRPVDWVQTPIGRLLALPTDGRPVTNWRRRDDALLDVAKGVRRAAEDIQAKATVARRRKLRSPKPKRRLPSSMERF